MSLLLKAVSAFFLACFIGLALMAGVLVEW